MSRILIIEDEESIAELEKDYLELSGFEVLIETDGESGRDRALAENFDMFILDLMLPGLDGFTFAQRIRETDGLSATRIIMLTARTQSEDIVRGLEAGADDYVTKPFDRKVLLARVKAVLRRGLPVTEGVDFDGLRIDESSRVATLRGKELDLTPGEFALLVRLVAHRGRVFVRPPDERTVDVQVAKLRQKLGKWADHIETVRGVGYRIGI
jgi:DNA-binding response OmpR family regulator